jgi:AraC-like DNA-binding protein
MKKPTAASPEFFSIQVAAARRFYLNLRPPPRTRLAVVCGGVEHCAPEYAVQRDTFPYYSLEYVARGEGCLKLGRKSHELRPGTVFAYGPGVRQNIVTNPQKPLVKYFVDFAGNHAKKWLQSCHLPPGKAAQVFPPGELQPLFDELIRSGQRGTRYAPKICDQLLGALGLRLRESRAPLKGTDSPAFATYLACRQLIHEEFRRLRTLEQAAKESHVDMAYLCRLFRRYDHQSPYLLLTRLKMNVAAEQLQQPGALVKNVAADLGFANPFHFSRVFKSVFSVAPETFRRLR